MSTIDEVAETLGESYGELIRASLGDLADGHNPFHSVTGLQPAAVFAQVHGRVVDSSDATDVAEMNRIVEIWRKGYDRGLGT